MGIFNYSLCYNQRADKVYHHPTGSNQIIQERVRSLNKMTEQEFIISELNSEIWLPVVGWEDIYSVSNIGRVRRDVSGRGRCKAGKILSPATTKQGYLLVGLQFYGRRKTTSVHTLVIAAFLGARPEGMEVNHIDGVKSNNRIGNLEYVTPKGNMAHAWRTGLMNPPCGDRNGSRTKPESRPRGENHHSKLRPETVIRGANHYARLHPERMARGENNGRAKIKDAQIPYIFELQKDGKSQRQIGAIVGLTASYVGKILNGKNRQQGA